MIQVHLEQMVLLLMYPQVKSSLTLLHNTYLIHLTSSHHIGVFLCHHGKGEDSPVRYFERERPHSHNFYYSLFLYIFCIIFIHLLLYLTCKLNFIIGMYV